MIDNPGALQVMNFADGQVQLVGVKAFYGGPLVDQELRYIRKHMPMVDTRVAAIFRKNRPIIPEGNTVIEADDDDDCGHASPSGRTTRAGPSLPITRTRDP